MARTSLAFFSLTEELTIAAWDAVDAKWDEVPRSYAPAWHTFMALRAVLFQIQDIVQGHIVDIIWSFVCRFITSYTIHWNAFEVLKAIGVFFAWSFSRPVAISISRMPMSLPTKSLANVLRRIPSASLLNVRSRRVFWDCGTLILYCSASASCTQQNYLTTNFT